MIYGTGTQTGGLKTGQKPLVVSCTLMQKHVFGYNVCTDYMQKHVFGYNVCTDY